MDRQLEGSHILKKKDGDTALIEVVRLKMSKLVNRPLYSALGIDNCHYDLPSFGRGHSTLSKTVSCGNQKMNHVIVTIMGPSKTGKTALAVSCVAHHFLETHEATVEDSYSCNITLQGLSVGLKIIDLGGWPACGDWVDVCACAKASNVMLLVYAVNDRSGFLQLKELAKLVKDACPTKPLMVVGNKADLAHKDAKARQVSHREGRVLSDHLDACFLETSAVNSASVKSLFDTAVEHVWQSAQPQS